MVLPATPEDIVNYLQLFATQLNPRTLSRRLTALKHWHTYQGFDDPTLHPGVRKTLKGIMNTHGKPKDKAPPLLPEQLSQIVAYLQQEDTLAAWRDNALLQLGYFGAFRRSELVAIQYEHIERHKEGITLLVPRSKTDQSGSGQHCAVPYGNNRLCPIRALDIWLGRAKIVQGPIFRQIDRWGTLGEKALTPLALTQIIKRCAQACQLPNPQAFSSHSLRRGLATSASHRGASLKAIMRQGRWQHVGTVLGYIEEGQRFDDNAAAAILQDTESQTSIENEK
jgi:integrase